MANAQLIDYTGKGREDEKNHAANILIFTKSTRLNMSAGLFKEIQNFSQEKRLEELAYMASTIPSSWEFIDVTFLLSDVTRASAQQITRTRTGSYAMQSQRVVDMSKGAVRNPYSLDSQLYHDFERASKMSLDSYERFISNGSDKQSARGILPMNINCNLVCKYNFRSFVELMLARQSLRVQGEYADLATEMKESVIAAWSWSEVFFESRFDKGIAMLEKIAKEIQIETGTGNGWDIAKAIDLLRKA